MNQNEVKNNQRQQTRSARPQQEREALPAWFDGKSVNEPAYAHHFLKGHQLVYTQGAFFTPGGMMTDDTVLKRVIYKEIAQYVSVGVSKKISSIMEVLKITASASDLPPDTDRIHLRNGTLYLDGTFLPTFDRVVRSRLPLSYNPDAPSPTQWLCFLRQLLHDEDIDTLQEYIGYCLIPSNKGQKMLVIKGNGGEGKSQIGTVMKRLFGDYAKDGSVGKVSENRFARADLEHILLMIDDDMRMEALRQTNYVKSLVTAQGRMDLEKKGRQSYQGYLYARMMAFSNGDLQSLYDRSDGFYRRQLVLTAKPKDAARTDDPDLAEKLCGELEGIFNWAFEGLRRLHAHAYKFTESSRAKENIEVLKRDANNIHQFLQAEDYVVYGAGLSIGSTDLYQAYLVWCEENGMVAVKQRSFSDTLAYQQQTLQIRSDNNIHNICGRRVRGWIGIGVKSGILGIKHSIYQKIYPDNPFA